MWFPGASETEFWHFQLVTMDHQICRVQLWNPVLQEPTQVQWCSFHLSLSQECCCPLGGDITVFLTKDVIEPVPPSKMKKGFYSPYFIEPKKGNGIRRVLRILDLQVLNLALCKLKWLVCDDRPEGRVLHCLNSSLAQAVPMIYLQGTGISVQGSPFRVVPVSSHLYKSHRGCHCPVKGSGHLHHQLLSSTDWSHCEPLTCQATPKQTRSHDRLHSPERGDSISKWSSWFGDYSAR